MKKGFPILPLRVVSASLSPDNQEIADFTGGQIRQGINLSLYENTPQYQQAIRIRELLEALREKEVDLRDIKFVESRGAYTSCPDKEDMEKLEKDFIKKIEGSPYETYYGFMIGEDVKHRPHEGTLQEVIQELRLKAEKHTEPVAHQYRIIKLQQDSEGKR